MGERTPWVGHGERLYKRTLSGYLVFDAALHGGQGPEEEDQETQARAITLFVYQGVLYRRTQTGEVSVEEDIRIGTSDGSGLVEGIAIPYPPEVHRRHYFLQAEEAEESEEEEGDSGADEEAENSNSGGDEEGEGEEEEVSEEEHEEHEGPEDDSEADKEN